MIKENLTLKGGLIETAAFHPMEYPVGSIHFMGIEEAEPELVEPGSLPMNTVQIKVQKRDVQSESFQSVIEVPRDHIFGEDHDNLYQILYIESVFSAEKRIAEKYWKHGWSSRDALFTNWQMFITNFLKIEKYTYIGQDPMSIASRISVLANLIAVKSRRGPGNFVILPAQLLMLLEENPSYEYIIDTNDKFSAVRTNTRFIKRGRIGNIAVYHDTKADWNSSEILVGRSTMRDEPGVHFCEYKNEFQAWEDPMTLTTKIKFLTRNTVVNVGECENLYIADMVKIGKKPWWRKLLGI